jgi:hypothetical protein
MVSFVNKIASRLKTWQKRPMYEMESIIGFFRVWRQGFDRFIGFEKQIASGEISEGHRAGRRGDARAVPR